MDLSALTAYVHKLGTQGTCVTVERKFPISGEATALLLQVDQSSLVGYIPPLVAECRASARTAAKPFGDVTPRVKHYAMRGSFFVQELIVIRHYS